MIGEVVSNRKIATGTFSMEINLGKGFDCDPGMFVMVGFKDLELFLNRPFSIAGIDGSRVRIIYNIRGKGTRRISSLSPSDEVQVTGPWGRPMPTPEVRTILVAGGIGVVPLLYYLKRFPEIPILYGARNASYLIQIEGYNTTIFTEDGSAGMKGAVTDGLKDDYDLVIACGPIPMLDKVNCIIKKGEAWGIFEGRMACGCGICLGCAIPGHGRYIRLCKDGPSIPFKEVDFEALRHTV